MIMIKGYKVICENPAQSEDMCIWGGLTQERFPGAMPELNFEPYLGHWFRAYSTVGRMSPQPYKATIPLGSCFRRTEKGVGAVNFTDRSRLPHGICHQMSSLVRSSVTWNICWWKKYCLIPWMAILAKALWGGKANLCLEYLSIPERRQTYLSHDGNAISPLSGVSWSPWGLVPLEDSAMASAAGNVGLRVAAATVASVSGRPRCWAQE